MTGIGQQLGGLFDQMLAGHAPSQADLEQVAANVVGKVIGREVTIEEVRQVRRGNYAPLRDVAEQFQRARAERAGVEPPKGPPTYADPGLAERIERAKNIGRARAVLGFGKDDVLTPDIIKGAYRQAAKKHHSDRGGSDERMVRINWARDLLVESLGVP